MSDQIIKIKAAFRQDEKPSGIDVNTYIYNFDYKKSINNF
jgi:hypothetical protein